MLTHGVLKLKSRANSMSQSHHRVDFPDGNVAVVIAAVEPRVSRAMIDVVKGSADHRHDRVLSGVH